jgi:hypothetical protein
MVYGLLHLLDGVRNNRLSLSLGRILVCSIVIVQTICAKLITENQFRLRMDMTVVSLYKKQKPVTYG